MADRPPAIIGAAPILVGAILIIVGLVRPAFLWGTGKVETGRSWFGENGMALGFIGFGAVLAIVGIATIMRSSSSK
jgi:hypothetical protein